ncbi:MAG: FG-GAP-like repeat-containing protein [Planctomycetota bacterium]|nr:FG-GAP-like repeat-containing protein [Planctomycetota bacterium]MDA1214854.1 FG-GAP-like repeat-containing protein [Planctomycetota bacterium]
MRVLNQKPEKALLNEAKLALSRGKLEDAERLALAAVEQKPNLEAAYLIAGEAAAVRGDLDSALKYYETISQSGSTSAIEALHRSGTLLIKLGRASAAEEQFRRVLESDPHHLETLHDLALLLRLEGRNWELRPYLFELLKEGLLVKDGMPISDSFADLMYLLRPAGNPAWVWLEPPEVELVERFGKSVPDDYLPLLGQARMALDTNDLASARSIFQKIVATDPHQIEAQAQLGLLLANTKSTAEFQNWLTELPRLDGLHPDMWVARGIVARKNNQTKPAIRCFWEALQIDPNHLLANYQLSQLLTLIDREDDAQPFAKRADLLSQLEYKIKEAGSELNRVRDVAVLMERLGRLWEAAAWYQVGADLFPDETWGSTERRNIMRQINAQTPPTIASSSPAAKLDFSMFNLPEYSVKKSVPAVGTTTSDNVIPSTSSVTWEEVSESTGLKFSYDNGSRPDDRVAYMFEFSGGGVGVVDYDGNAWPDLYLTQGGTWPVETNDDGTHGNRLFRNLGHGKFQEVATLAHVEGADFSQGVTVGDFNSDGFPDLYVANIGGNRLYENNGDGTYSDVTALSSTSGNVWTLSCAMADFNGDTLPDIYAVNYLGGNDIYTRLCEKYGKTIQCYPTMFPAEQDELYLNLGDGRFENITSAAGIKLPDGKGMGIVVADFRQVGRLDIFIANDTTANFLFVNQTAAGVDGGERPVFTEEGVLSGVAFNESGQAQSCMGVAVGDVNRDRRLDLFVTNFTREGNNLFIQRNDQMFADESRQANLYDAGYSLMGWGTQFLDAECDGELDLVVANGELEDLSDVGYPSRSPFSYFSNQKAGRFVEVPASQLGPYFEHELLGRAIATLDWNRDGLIDFCATNVDRPVALLTNMTVTHGHYLNLSLCGVLSSRDAIGTTIHAKMEDRIISRQLTAGDGFEASNERTITLGLGTNTRIDELMIQWPSGNQQSFTDVRGDRNVVAIEGAERLIDLPPP